MNWIEILTKGRYPLFVLSTFLDGESANFVGSTLAGNGIFNIFIIYAISVFLETSLDTIYYLIGRKLPLKKTLNKLVKSQKGRELQKRIDSLCNSKPYMAAFVIKHSGPISIPGLIYFGGLRALQPLRFFAVSLTIAVLKGAIVSFLGYMVGKGFSIFKEIYGVMHVILIISTLAILIYFAVKVFPKAIKVKKPKLQP